MSRKMTREWQIEKMQKPDEWVLWPMLPLKVLGGREVGVLMQQNGEVKPEVYLGNIIDGIKKDAETIQFESFEAIHDAGWVID